LTPHDVVAGSARRVWWKCPKGRDHEWEETVQMRGVRGAGCSFCTNQRVSTTNAFTTTHPNLAREWHPTKNGDLKPRDVVAGSNKVVWWTCKKGVDHEWKATVTARAVRKSGCPFCANQRVSITNSLETCFPEIAAE